MALVKISELIAAGTLTGTEVYPLVQSGNTKKAAPSPPGTLVATTIPDYDAEGNPLTVIQDGITTTYTYDANGNPATATRFGVVWNFTYDGAGNLTGIETA